MGMPSGQKEVLMNRARVFALATLALFAVSWTSAQAGVIVGIGVGGPGPYYHRYYRPYYYGPRVVVAVPPVVIGPAPVYVAPPPPPLSIPWPLRTPAPFPPRPSAV